MPKSIMAKIISSLGEKPFEMIDIIGGSPELHPDFRFFVNELCSKGYRVQVRTNLINLIEPSLSDLIPWSTEGVLTSTLAVLDGKGLKTTGLPAWSDIDTYDDLKALVEKSRNTAFAKSRTVRYAVARIGFV